MSIFGEEIPDILIFIRELKDNIKKQSKNLRNMNKRIIRKLK